VADLPVRDHAPLDAILAESSGLMKRGLQLVEQYDCCGAAASLDAAIRCFDAAAGLRGQLPLDAHAAFRYDLAACYLNRAEALLRRDDAVSVRRAIAALDTGARWLETLPLADDTRFVRRLAVAWQNRGLARLRHDPASADGARDLRSTIALLSRRDLRMPDDRDQLLSAALVNLAASILRSPLPAGDAASLRRHCADATDIAEDALSVVAHWEREGVERFRSIGCDLFTFAASAYAAYQPRFLDEFLSEWLDASRSSAGFVTSTAIVDAAARARRIASARQSAPIVFTLGSGFQSSAHLRSRL
jgi:hypothetical protein